MGVVVITGCSSGFGYHSALAFGRRGDRVYATMRNPSKGDLAKVISDEGSTRRCSSSTSTTTPACARGSARCWSERAT